MPNLATGPRLAILDCMARPTLGEQVRAAREERGLTQLELAKLCGLKAQTNISRLESDSHECNLNLLRRVARALKKDLVIYHR